MPIDSHDAPRILIVRLSAIGDVIHGVPVLNALRARYPKAFIAWVVEGRAADLLEGHAALDQLIRVPRRWIKSLRGVREVRRRLRELRFDITVDLQCLTKSALAAWLSGAPRRIGAAGEHGRELSKWFNNERVEAGGEHVIDHYLQIARPLGIDPARVEFKLPESAADAALASEFLQQAGLGGEPFAVLSPGAGWPSKMWPTERYAEVADFLGRERNLRSVVIWGTPDERPLAEAIVTASSRYASLAPPTTLTELGALVRRSRLFVGSDTGPMHLAVAVGVPTISLHGTSRAGWTGAYGRDNIRLQTYYHAGSARQRRTAGNEAMRAIEVATVCEACTKLLDRAPQCRVIPAPHLQTSRQASR